MTKYLYGDSSPFPYSVNVLELLGDALSCAGRALEIDQAVRAAAARVELARIEAFADRAELDRVRSAARAALGPLAAGAQGGASADRPATQAALRALAAAEAELTAAADELTRVAERVAAEASAAADAERHGLKPTLEALLLQHDLPGATTSVLVEVDERRARGRVLYDTGFGVEAELELELAAEHPLGRQRRVGELRSGLFIELPRPRGLLRRGPRRLRLDRHLITSVAVAPSATRVTLRAPHGQGGFELAFNECGAVRLEVCPVGRDGVPRRGDALAPDGPVAGGLEAFRTALLEALGDLGRRRVRLRAATLDGVSLGALAEPGELARRLIGALAPVVGEIARRSPARGELVLKRELGDGRREELFIARAALVERVVRFAPALRPAFEPLGLELAPLVIVPRDEARAPHELGFSDEVRAGGDDAPTLPGPRAGRHDTLVTKPALRVVA